MCTCKRWKYQYTPITKRTCRHLIAILGAEHEQKRCPDSFFGLTYQKPADAPNRKSPWALAEKPMRFKPLMAEDVLRTPLVNHFMSIKYDGNFLRWSERQLFTKSGRRLDAPAWLINEFIQAGCAHMTLDCELYSSNRQEVIEAVLGHVWSPNLTVYVYDVVDTRHPFVERLRFMSGQIRETEHVHVVKYTPIVQWREVMDTLQEVEANGLEGLVIRHPLGVYEGSKTRSDMVYKLKPWRQSTGQIIEWLPAVQKGATVKIHTPLIRGPPDALTMLKLFIPRKYLDRATPTVVFNYAGLDDHGAPDLARFVQFI